MPDSISAISRWIFGPVKSLRRVILPQTAEGKCLLPEGRDASRPGDFESVSGGPDSGRSRAIPDVRIAIGSVAPTVIRAMAAEEALRGQPLDAGTIAAAERALLTDIAPIDDIRSTARYRTRVAANLLREFLTT